MDNEYFAENMQSGNIKRANKHSVSIPTLIISLLTTIVLVLIVVNNRDNIKEMFGFETNQVEVGGFEQLLVGDEVKLSGDIFDDGDLVNYTHIFDSKDYGELGLKSQNINLNNYSDDVYLEGIVEKIQQGVPVIEVDTIYSLDMEEDDQEIIDQDLSGDAVEEKYLPNLGLYLNGDFFDKYSLVNDGEDGVLKIKDIETNQIINLDYFVCNSSIVDQDCDKFNKIFADTAVSKFVQTDGTVFYKQSEVQSWFFSNGGLFGYFVNDVDDPVLKKLAKHLIFINDDFVDNNILDKVKTLCWEPGTVIKNISSKKLVLKNKEIYLDIDGDDSESVLFCELKIDPLSKIMAKLVDLKVVGDLEVVDTDSDAGVESGSINNKDDSEGDKIDVVENTDWDSDVEQFPINLDKTLEFTSRRGHTIVFPSSNIAYAGKSVSEDFGQDGVNCFSVMNVVAYADKQTVNEKGNVKIYECSIKDEFDDSSEGLILKTVGDKTFVISIIDPLWIKFANNINIVIK